MRPSEIQPTQQGISDVDLQRKVELYCTDFENGWDRDSANRVRDFLAGIETDLHANLVAELVAIDCELCAAASDPPLIENYVDQLPEWRERVEKGFAIWAGQSAETAVGNAGLGVALTPGSDIGDYKIIREIGRGGMGTVYEAEQHSLDRRVAIKTLTQSNVASLIARFGREARAVARLHHTNIIEVFGSGVDGGIPYIAMQLVDGRGLNELISEARTKGADGNLLDGVNRFESIARVGFQVASALEHAHQNGVLHRDIKPSNLLVDQMQNAWVSDFGLAKLGNDDSDETIAGGIVGTLRYLPPESFDGNWDERCDVYSLGLTLYELITLQPAFAQREQKQLLHQIVHGGEIGSTRVVDKSTPLDLDTIVRKASSRDPKMRYQSAGALAADLRRFIDGEPVFARRASLLERAWKWSKRKPAAASLLATIAAVIVIGFPLLAVLWQRAEVARADANDARQASEAASYGVSMLLAQKHFENGEVYEMQRMLSQWDPSVNRAITTDHRGWEWQHLRDQQSTASLSFGIELPYVWSVAVRPDDEQIASVHGVALRDKQFHPVICLWDAETGTLQHKLRDESSRMFGLAYSPDGGTLASIGLNLDGANRGTLTLWDSETGKKIRTMELQGEFNERHINGFYGITYLPSVSYSSDGKHLLVSPEPCEMLDAETLAPVWNKTFKGKSACFLGDEKMLCYLDNKLVLLSRNTGEKLRQCSSKGGGNHLTSSGGFVSFATRSDLRVVNADDLSVHFKVDKARARWCRISPDGKLLAYGGRNGVLTIESLSDGTPPIRFLGHSTTLTDGHFSHDGRWLVTSSLDGSVKRWDLASTRSSRSLNTGYPDIADIAFAASGDKILFAGHRTATRDDAGSIDIDGKGNAKKYDIATTYKTLWPRHDFAFSDDGMRLAAPASELEPIHEIGHCSSGKVTIWETERWTKIGDVDASGFVTCVAWNEDRSMLAVGCTEVPEDLVDDLENPNATDIDPTRLRSTVRLFAVADHAELIGEYAFGGECFSLALFGRQLVVGCSDSIRLLEFDRPGASQQVDTFQFELKRSLPNQALVVDMDLSADGKRLAVAKYPDDEFAVYDVSSGEEICMSRTPREVRSIRFSPNGRRIAVVGTDSRVYFCDAATGNQLLELKGSAVSAGTTPVNASVKFSRDGKRIAVNAIEGKIKVWEVSDSVK